MNGFEEKFAIQTPQEHYDESFSTLLSHFLYHCRLFHKQQKKNQRSTNHFCDFIKWIFWNWCFESHRKYLPALKTTMFGQTLKEEIADFFKTFASHDRKFYFSLIREEKHFQQKRPTLFIVCWLWWWRRRTKILRSEKTKARYLNNLVWNKKLANNAICLFYIK